jgi:hypothetical protein
MRSVDLNHVRVFVQSRTGLLLAAGLAIRFLVMPFSIQGDIVEQSWIANFLAQGHLNVYAFYYSTYGSVFFPPGSNFIPAAGFPPLFYFLQGGYIFLLSKLGLLAFTASWNYANLWLFPDQSRVFFLLKALFLPFDLLGLALFVKCIPRGYRFAGAVAWLFNPIFFYVSYVWGQTDIMAAAMTMLALYFAWSGIKSQNLRDCLLSCFAVGLAASFKLFALALLPIVAFFMWKSSKRFLGYYLIAGISPFVLVIPFLSRPFLESMLSYPGYILARNSPAIYPQFTIYATFAAYLILLYHLYFLSSDHSFDSLVTYGLALFAILYGLSVWLPNWLVWGMPFLLLFVFRKPKLFPVYVLVILFYFIFIQSWGNELWMQLFCPLTYSGPCLTSLSGAFGRIPSLRDMVPGITTELSGLAYTGIGVSLGFMILCSSNRKMKGSAPRPRKWILTVLIPIAIALLTFAAGISYIVEHGFPLSQTLIARGTEDPYFFSSYLVAILVLTAWAVFAGIRGLPSSSKSRRSESVDSSLQ